MERLFLAANQWMCLVGTVTRNLSSMLDTVYLKPSIPTYCPRRLGDTREVLLFLESVNEYIWQNNITTKPVIFALDVVNFFPSVTGNLAQPAISEALRKNGFKRAEINAVLRGLQVLRSGSFFKWKDYFWRQISGCALGDVDSCSYTDLAMSFLLNSMIPEAEKALAISLELFKIYRDDSLGMLFEHPEKIVQLLEFFNKFNKEIQWTLEICSLCNMPLVCCPHYDHLDFLDIRITWMQVKKGDIFVWQFNTAAYSKPTDVHAYLSPSSCTAPHLNEDGVSVAKTVGVRLRSLHSNDLELLQSLNLFSGYLVSRGYNEQSIKFNLAAMANRDRISLLKGQYKPPGKKIVPLVTDLHPAITCLSTIMSESFSEAIRSDPLMKILIPSSSLIVSYRKLPNLARLLCCPDQNRFLEGPPVHQSTGYVDTGCNCHVCKVSTFGRFVQSPSLPGYKIKIPSTVSCASGPSVVYHLVCRSGRPECARAHYVGIASQPPSNAKAMGVRSVSISPWV